jgi:hypothetical protein
MATIAPEYVVNEQGSKVKVILPIETYQHMIDELLILKARQGDRDALLALTPKVRDQLLAEQAEKLLEHYQTNSEWRELQTYDLHDYDE